MRTAFKFALAVILLWFPLGAGCAGLLRGFEPDIPAQDTRSDNEVLADEIRSEASLSRLIDPNLVQNGEITGVQIETRVATLEAMMAKRIRNEGTAKAAEQPESWDWITVLATAVGSYFGLHFSRRGVIALSRKLVPSAPEQGGKSNG